MTDSKAHSTADFLTGARRWLESNAERRPPREAIAWGDGSDRVSLFRDTSPDDERAQVEAAREWQRRKFDAGYGAISWPVEYGGAGLSNEHELAFRGLENEFVTPPIVEAVSISVALEAATILALGTDEQKERWVRALRRGDKLCCQLFSEPAAGSDLGSIATRATRDGDGWLLNGQKVWTSGAQFADLGYVICRTDAVAPRQQAFTAFLTPMDAAGVQVVPLRQMTGGTSFNEVFFDDLLLPDSARLGAVGGGWHAMMTTLAFERRNAADGLGFGDTELVDRLVLTAQHLGRDQDPIFRQQIARLYSRNRMRNWLAERIESRIRAGGVPGPEGSMLKLGYTRELQDAGELAGSLLGPAIVADTGEWGTFAWSALLCGVPGIRVGAGTDEIQKNTIAERILGLPREPR